MGYYIKEFYFEKRDLYFLVAVALLLYANYTGFPLPYFNYQSLIILVILFAVAKGFLPSSLDPILLIVFMTAAILTLFLTLFQVFIFIALAFAFLKLLKAF